MSPINLKGIKNFIIASAKISWSWRPRRLWSGREHFTWFWLYKSPPVSIVEWDLKNVESSATLTKVKGALRLINDKQKRTFFYCAQLKTTKMHFAFSSTFSDFKGMSQWINHHWVADKSTWKPIPLKKTLNFHILHKTICSFFGVCCFITFLFTCHNYNKKLH